MSNQFLRILPLIAALGLTGLIPVATQGETFGPFSFPNPGRWFGSDNWNDGPYPGAYPPPGYPPPAAYPPAGYAAPGYGAPGYGTSGYGTPGYALEDPDLSSPGTREEERIRKLEQRIEQLESEKRQLRSQYSQIPPLAPPAQPDLSGAYSWGRPSADGGQSGAPTPALAPTPPANPQLGAAMPQAQPMPSGGGAAQQPLQPQLHHWRPQNQQ